MPYLISARLRGGVGAFARDERKTDTKCVIHYRCRYASIPCLEQHLLAVPSLLISRWSEHTY
jgi:hypothetical protein